MQKSLFMPEGRGEHTPTNNKGLTAGNDQTPKETTPSANYTPTMPTPGTQPHRLLCALQEGRAVDPLAAWRDMGIYRLADTVFQLRGMGWPVITDQVEVKNRFGEVCRVASYRLEGLQWT
jgi:hypothetical protein